MIKSRSSRSLKNRLTSKIFLANLWGEADGLALVAHDKKQREIAQCYWEISYAADKLICLLETQEIKNAKRK